MHVIHHDNSGEQTAYINEFTHMVNNPKSIEYDLGCRKEGWMIKIFKRKRKKTHKNMDASQNQHLPLPIIKTSLIYCES